MNTQTRIFSIADTHTGTTSIHHQMGQRSREGRVYPKQSSGDAPNLSVFDRLLAWLGPDSDTAGKQYESIRARLIKMFRARRCEFAEDLADVTFEHVSQKLRTLSSVYIGDPVPYFYGVAKKIYLEYLRSLKANSIEVFCLPCTSNDPDLEKHLDLLEKALCMIPKTDRELVLSYYEHSGKDKVKHRRALAKQLGIELNALRLRVFRTRRAIKNYMIALDED